MNCRELEFASRDLSGLMIREMQRSDLSEVLAMAMSFESNPWTRTMFIAEMSNSLSHCFVVEEKKNREGKLLGFICFRNIEDESELLNICVHPHRRRLGIARKLMEHYLGFSRDIKTFYLEVDSLNHSAIHLYRLFSYEVVGIRKKLYQKKFDALLMARRG